MDEDGGEKPRLPRAVMDQSSRPEPTTLEAVGNQWHYALVVVQAGDDDNDTLAWLIVEKNNFKHKCNSTATS